MKKSTNQQLKLSIRKDSIEQLQHLSQSEVQQKYVSLQSVLMLTQLNCSFYELIITLQKKITKIEDKFYRIKMDAFLRISTVKRKGFYYDKQPNQISTSSLPNYRPNVAITKKDHQNYKTELTLQRKHAVSIKQLQEGCKITVTNFITVLQNKKNNAMSYSLIQLYIILREPAAIKIKSDKLSKVETTDSQKSKIFKRSVQKRVYHKSFSMQKSSLEQKQQYFIPVKYQPQPKVSPSPNANLPNLKIDPSYKQSYNPSAIYINRYLQNKGQLSNQRKNVMLTHRQRTTMFKTSSTNKINITTNKQREDKMQELEYLKRKYNKLITQFNWFSERFLKVIEEQEYVQ